MFNPVVKMLAFLGCECGDFAGSPTCLPEPKTKVGESIAFVQTSGCIKSETTVVCWKDTTVAATQQHANFTVSVVYHQQVVVVASTTKRDVESHNPYVIVYNSNNELIGQIISDVIAVDIAGASAGAALGAPFELCIQQSQLIQVDPFFTTPDFAYRKSENDKFVALKVTPTMKNGKWCADVDKDGYYVATMTSTKPYVDSSSTGLIVSVLIALIALLLA